MKKITCKVYSFNNPDMKVKVLKETFKKALDEYLSSSDQRLGEMNPNPEEWSIDLSRVSHKINAVRIENDDVNADIELIDTDCGKIAQSILHAGGDLHFQPRMTGIPIYETDESGNKKMIDVEDFQILSFDIVM